VDAGDAVENNNNGTIKNAIIAINTHPP